MAWLGTRLRGRHFSRGERATEADLPPEGETATATGARPLVLLVPEARKTAAFRLHTFADAEEAAAFIQRWFWPGTAGGVIAFWALHERPLHESGGSPPEAIALVREEEGSDVVYFSSFRDMGLARSLVRAKAERGLDLGLTLVYWAAPVAIEYDRPGHVRLTPSAPPALQPVLAVEAPALEQQEQEPEPQTDALEEAAAQVAVVAEPPTEAPEDGAAPAEVEERARVSANGNGLAPWTEVSDDVEETAEVSTKTDAEPEPLAASPDDIEETAGTSAKGNGLAPWTEVSDDAEETAGISAEADAPDVWGTAEVTEEVEDEAVAIDRLVSELDKVLRVSRWDDHDGPFEGFGSPPGTF